MTVQCKNCARFKPEWCEYKHDSPDPDFMRDCDGFRQKTNGDVIRAMDDSELSRFIEEIVSCRRCKCSGDCKGPEVISRYSCASRQREWLQSPAEVHNEPDH